MEKKNQKTEDVDFSEMTLEEIFEHLSEVENLSCLSFEKKVANKLSKRSDLHAFILLDKLFPNDDRDIVSCAEHDEIYLDIDTDKLLEIATIDQIRELVCCGVHFDSSLPSLKMFA
jgi:hypothetical protein